jgi:hypothetical protein
VTIEEVNTAIKQLNTNKAHDYFGLTAENFIHAINRRDGNTSVIS